MAEGLLEAFGAGLQGAGAVLSPEVHQMQAHERQFALQNVGRSLEIRKAQRALDADTKFSEAVSGMQPSAMKDSASVLEALKGVPLDIIAESPRAHATMQMVSQMQAREQQQETKRLAVEQRYDQMEQQATLSRERAADMRLGAEERARHNLSMERITTQMNQMRSDALKQGIDLRRDILDFRKDQGNASLIPLGAEGKEGADLLKSLDPSLAAIVKKVGDYDLNPQTLSTRGGHREKILALAAMYNPQYDDKDYAQIKRSMYDFSTGKQGQTTRSINVAVEHLDTAKRFADALKNKDTPLINKIANEFATQTGGAAPTSLEAVKEIVADEVVKGVIGGPGALADRESAAKKIRAASSPEQFAAVVNAWTELMGGQLKGLEKQYEGSTRRKDFQEKYLTQRARDALKSADHSAPAAGAKVVNWGDLK